MPQRKVDRFSATACEENRVKITRVEPGNSPPVLKLPGGQAFFVTDNASLGGAGSSLQDQGFTFDMG